MMKVVFYADTVDELREKLAHALGAYGVTVSGDSEIKLPPRAEAPAKEGADQQAELFSAGLVPPTPATEDTPAPAKKRGRKPAAPAEAAPEAAVTTTVEVPVGAKVTVEAQAVAATPAPENTAVTEEMARAALTAFNEKFGIDKTRELVLSCGAKSFSKLGPEQWPLLVAKCRQALSSNQDAAPAQVGA